MISAGQYYKEKHKTEHNAYIKIVEVCHKYNYVRYYWSTSHVSFGIIYVSSINHILSKYVLDTERTNNELISSILS